jgi:Lon protease-like protein
MSDTLLPMFPLGSPLLPGAFLPLHVFEARYREMFQRVLDGDRTFGVVLIERGSEVGGGDVRFTVGCRAAVIDVHHFDDGRLAVQAVGTNRIEVLEWLADDPYPQARVRDLLESAEPPAPAAVERVEHATLRAHELVELYVRHDPALDGFELQVPAEPIIAVWALASQLPLGPLDRQHLLDAGDLDVRAGVLAEAIDEQIELARARFGV